MVGRDRRSARARAGIAGGVAVCALAGLFAVRRGSHDDAPAAAARARSAALTSPMPVPAAGASSAEVTPPAALPASLEGTEADGAITAGTDGHLVIDIELRRLFDHFLAASGEEPIAVMRARIAAVLRARLPATAAAEAIEILDQYLAYREAARRFAAGDRPGDLAGALDQIHDLRARMFSPAVVKAFFADEEAATYAAIARRDALADRALSDAERERRLADLEARIPAAARDARAASLAPIQALERETALRAAGATDEQIAAARTAALGADAAGRLAALDRAHAAWDDRLARFRAARTQLLADPRLDDAERRRRIDDLLARSFTAPERIRVEALDRMDRRTH